MYRFALLGFDHCEASGITVAADALQLVNTLWSRERGTGPLFEWQVLSPDGDALDTPAGIHLAADGDWSAAVGADVIFLPAMYYLYARDLIRQVGDMRRHLVSLHQRLHEGSRIAATCTGTFLLGESGLLDGRRGTTSWWLKRAFAERYPRVLYEPDAIVTEQDGVYCSGPHQARSSMLLQLIEPCAGRDLALLTAKLMLIDTNHLSQAPYTTLQGYLGHRDPLVARAQKRMQARLAEQQPLDWLAAELSTSVRTLIRRFSAVTGQTPASYHRSLRVDAAKRLLETTDRNWERIAEDVGYADSGAFRRLFRRELGLTPQEYRRRFGGLDGVRAGHANRPTARIA